MTKYALSVCGLLAPLALIAQEAPLGSPRDAAPAETSSAALEEVQALTLDTLHSVTSVEISPDGKFLYAAAFNAGAVSVFSRDLETGLLNLVDTVSNPDLQAAVSIRLSKDGKYAAAAAFGANAVTLFARDAESGKLTVLDAVRLADGASAGLNFVIDARFSPDNRYLYTAASDGVGVFRIDGEKLVYATGESAEGQLRGLRAVVISPDGAWIYAMAASSNSIGVLRRDTANGELEVTSVLTDGVDGNDTIGGAFRAACSADGKFLYVSSGRFGGDQAVSTYEVDPAGALKLVGAHVNDTNGFEGFEGGNDIKVSLDGKFVYALGTLSDRLVRFQREPGTGKLTFIGSQPVGHHATPGSAGLCFSPDGKFIYVADEDANTIVVLKQP